MDIQIHNLKNCITTLNPLSQIDIPTKIPVPQAILQTFVKISGKVLFTRKAVMEYVKKTR